MGKSKCFPAANTIGFRFGQYVARNLQVSGDGIPNMGTRVGGYRRYRRIRLYRLRFEFRNKAPICCVFRIASADIRCMDAMDLRAFSVTTPPCIRRRGVEWFLTQAGEEAASHDAFARRDAPDKNSLYGAMRLKPMQYIYWPYRNPHNPLASPKTVL